MQVNCKKTTYSLAQSKMQNPAVYLDYKEEFEDFCLLDFMFGFIIIFLWYFFLANLNEKIIYS